MLNKYIRMASPFAVQCVMYYEAVPFNHKDPRINPSGHVRIVDTVINIGKIILLPEHPHCTHTLLKAKAPENQNEGTARGK